MSVRRTTILAGLAALAAVLLAPSLASGSVLIAPDARKPSLKVGANGDAAVSWRDKSGKRQTLLVPMRGRVLPGETIDGKNVAKKNKKWKLPFKPILRKGPKGFFYALQTWRPRPDAPPELRLSRWKGPPTQLTIEATFNNDREAVGGSVAFRNKPVFGKSPTPAGKKLQLSVLLDCFDCPKSNGSGWGRIAWRALKAKDGKYALKLLPANQGSRYRAQIVGPNRGLHLGPDMQTIAQSARPPLKASLAG
ncbi:MAG: hypothetical protein ACR2OD_00815 [Gaiellaceae bacterium]